MTSHLEEGLLQELVDGEIPSSELVAIQAHLSACAECRARLDEARAIGAEADRLIEALEVPEAPARAAPRTPRAGSRPWLRNLAWAATVVIAAGAGYVARDTGPGVLARQDAAKESVANDTQPPAAVTSEPRPPSIPVPSPAAALQSGAVAGADQPARERASNTAPAPAASRPEPTTTVDKAGTLGERRVASAPADSDSVRKRAARTLGDTQLRLDELVVTGVNEGSKKVAASPPPSALKQTEPKGLVPDTQSAGGRLGAAVSGRVAGLSAKAVLAPVEVTLQEALKRLNGSLRLIEGMVPLRLEVLGPDVRVVYPLTTGELLLAQRMEAGKLVYRLLAPAGFPADSLDRLRARVRD